MAKASSGTGNYTVNAGTVNIGLKYKDGVVLLTDSQVSLGTQCEHNAKKLYEIHENMGLTMAGTAGTGQFLAKWLESEVYETINTYEGLRVNYTEKLKTMEESINNIKNPPQGGGTSQAPVQLLPVFKPQPSLEELEKQKKLLSDLLADEEVYILKTTQSVSMKHVNKNKKGRKVYVPGTMIVQKYGDNVYVEVASAANHIQDFVHVSRPGGISYMGLLGGVDKDGIQLFKIDGAGAYFEEEYASTGSGSHYALGVLSMEYKPNMTRDEALKLAVKAGKSAAKNDSAVDDIFQIQVIEKDVDSIKSTMLGGPEIEALKAAA